MRLLILLILLVQIETKAKADALDKMIHYDYVDEELKFLLNQGYVDLNVAHLIHHGDPSKDDCGFEKRQNVVHTQSVRVPLHLLNSKYLIGKVELQSSDQDIKYLIRVWSWTAPSGLYLDYGAEIRFQGNTLGSITGASGTGVIYKNKKFQIFGQNNLIRLIPTHKCRLAEIAVSDSNTPIRLTKSFEKRIQ